MEGIKQNLISLLERIPIFDGLSVEECKRVMSTGEPVKIPRGKTVYPANTPGSQMLILLMGTASIQSPDGREITQVEAIDTVGEMEIFTAAPRVAKVVAHTDISGLVIAKNELEVLIAHEPSLGVQLLKNIIDSLGRKLAASNAQAFTLPPVESPDPDPPADAPVETVEETSEDPPEEPLEESENPS